MLKNLKMTKSYNKMTKTWTKINIENYVKYKYI